MCVCVCVYICVCEYNTNKSGDSTYKFEILKKLQMLEKIEK